MHGIEQVLPGRCLDHVTAAEGKRPARNAGIVVAADEHHRQTRAAEGESARRFQSIHLRHGDVGDDDVRSQNFDEGHERDAVADDTDDLATIHAPEMTR